MTNTNAYTWLNWFWKIGNDSSCHEEIALPYFYRDKMYKGMELDKEYTLEELEL